MMAGGGAGGLVEAEPVAARARVEELRPRRPSAAASGAAAAGLRILAVSRQWQGANDYAFVRAFRRAGHSVVVVDPASHVPPGWSSGPLRYVRRALYGRMARRLNEEILARAGSFRPHLFFAFKGREVTAGTLRRLRRSGIVSINFYPDTGFRDHGAYLAEAVAEYDWIFTTKTFGVDDLAGNYGMRRASFLPHGFDPEVHRPVALAEDEVEKYACDVTFVGARTAKKERTLAHLVAARPHLRYRIWGGTRWRLPAARDLSFGEQLTGLEYAKALAGARIALSLLYEGDPGAPCGDDITARTFEVPAAGGFMLHERTDAALALFAEGEECAFFSSPEELVEKVDRYLADPAERRRVALNGHERVSRSGHSVDDRAAAVLQAYGCIAAAGRTR